MELAATFFADTLASRLGAKARGYLADRAIAPQTQLQFRLGYAPPDRYALKEHLGKQGVPVDDMVEAGLLATGDDNRLPYDRFRDRVMFPMGIVFPLATTDPPSFEFLKRFSTDAPFKMSAKHFMVGVIAKNGGFAWRKPDPEIAARLEEFIG